MASRNNVFELQAALKGQFAGRLNSPPTDSDYANDSSLGWVSGVDGISRIPGFGVDADDRAHVGSTVAAVGRIPVSFYLGAAGAIVTTPLLASPYAKTMVIDSIEEIHATAESTAAALTLVITKETGTTAPGGGTAVMSNTFNLKGTANTTQFATLNAPNGDGVLNAAIQLAQGDRLSAKLTGTPHEIAAITLTVWLRPGFKGCAAVYQAPGTGASIVTQNIIQVNRDCQIIGIQAYFSTAGTDAGALTLDVTKDTGTNAPGAGTTVLASTLNLKGTINTVNALSLTATAANLLLAAGNRVSVKITGTPTALAGLTVIVWLQNLTGGYYGQVDVPFCVQANGSLLAAQAFFISDRDYEVVDASAIWSTAGTDGGAVTADIGIAKLTTAPGSATSVTTGATSVKTTANTTAVMALSTSRRNRLLSRGDRLVIPLAGTLTSLAGVAATVSLRPA